VVRNFLPREALYMIRYHSFYAAHRERDYDWLMNDPDRQRFEYVRAFNQYDLYPKSTASPDVERRTPLYQELIDRYFPNTLAW